MVVIQCHLEEDPDRSIPDAFHGAESGTIVAVGAGITNPLDPSSWTNCIYREGDEVIFSILGPKTFFMGEERYAITRFDEVLAAYVSEEEE